MLDVIGPPNSPAGVYAEPVMTNKRAYRLHWTDGNDNGSPIQFYNILAATHHSPVYKTLLEDIPEESTLQYDSRQRTFLVGELRPVFYSVPQAPPEKVPDHVGGGGGSVGTLKITWMALSIEDQGAKGIGYNVYWRESFKEPWNFVSTRLRRLL
ncbi:unnamed protein product [Acanthosepion pharaonis]|uniref:Uncharacterized protein n=1 Tax=Acanthosepion pharaonis TaxID=158019 RepID=A0A812EME5_ACAPH|nr:unnamed protein product [Sepia pharaonis]